MKRIEKFRLINKYTIGAMGLLLISLVVSWFFTSEMFYWLFQADFQKEPDLIGQDREATIQAMLGQINNWEMYIDFAMRYTIYLFPIFALLPIIQFYHEKNGYFSHAFVRLKNYRRYMVTTIVKYSLISGLCITIPFIIYFSIGNMMIMDHLQDIGNYDIIFGENFYDDHPFLFFLFLATSIYFALGVTFGFMGCAVVLWTDKKYMVIVIPMVFYLVIGNLAETLGLPLLNVMQSVVAFNTLYTTFEIFIPLILPVIASFSAIIYKQMRGDYLGY
ncbi:MAG TPA: hypothetical protein VF095_05305 [Bacillota bacterium]